MHACVKNNDMQRHAVAMPQLFLCMKTTGRGYNLLQTKLYVFSTNGYELMISLHQLTLKQMIALASYISSMLSIPYNSTLYPAYSSSAYYYEFDDDGIIHTDRCHSPPCTLQAPNNSRSLSYARDQR